MAVSDEAASAAEPSAADAWFQRKMALHEAARRAPQRTRDRRGRSRSRSDSSGPRRRFAALTASSSEARGGLSALRARLETVIAPRRARAGRARPHGEAQVGSETRVRVLRARRLVRRARARSRRRRRHQRDALVGNVDAFVGVLARRRRRAFLRSRATGSTCSCAAWTPRTDATCSWSSARPRTKSPRRAALERAALRVRREPPEWGGDGHDGVVVVALDAAEACGLAGYRKRKRKHALQELRQGGDTRRVRLRGSRRGSRRRAYENGAAPTKTHARAGRRRSRVASPRWSARRS